MAGAIQRKNQLQIVIPYFENPRFSFEKVKGHSGEKDWNDYVDRLAVEAKKTKL